MNVIHLERNNFDELVKNRVLVDFYAEWCGPCKMMSSVLEKAEADIDVVKVNIDEYQDIARQYGVMSIPTLILFDNSKEVKRNVGFISQEQLEKFVK